MYPADPEAADLEEGELPDEVNSEYNASSAASQAPPTDMFGYHANGPGSHANAPYFVASAGPAKKKNKGKACAQNGYHDVYQKQARGTPA